MKRLAFDEIARLKIGRIFYEEEGGRLFRFIVSKTPVTMSIVIQGLNYPQLEWKGKNRKGEEYNFLTTEGLSGYGPRIMVTFRKDRKKP